MPIRRGHLGPAAASPGRGSSTRAAPALRASASAQRRPGGSQVFDELVAEPLHAFQIVPTAEGSTLDDPLRSLRSEPAHALQVLLARSIQVDPLRLTNCAGHGSLLPFPLLPFLVLARRARVMVDVPFLVPILALLQVPLGPLRRATFLAFLLLAFLLLAALRLPFVGHLRTSVRGNGQSRCHAGRRPRPP